MRSREEEDGDYLLRLDYRGLPQPVALPIRLFPTPSKVVLGARQWLEQLQGADVESHPRQAVGQNLQVPRLQEGVVHHG